MKLSFASDRFPAAPWAAALAVTALCWLLTVRDATRMAGGMRMPGGWTMSMAWMAMPGESWLGAATMFLLMWQVMMIAMMLPSAMPMVLLYRRLRLSRQARGEWSASEIVLLAGYFGIWLAFGVAAFAIGYSLSILAMRAETLSRTIPFLTGVALALAGAYQLSPLKRSCLRHCRSPLSFFTTGWRPGWWGALQLGVHHGAYCAACCWALMLIQLSLGVMDLRLMAAVAAIIALEKTTRHGERIALVVGVLAIASGVYLAAAAARAV